MDKVKPYLPIILPVLAGIALFIFWDYAVEIILGLFGLGAVAVASKRQDAKQAHIIADEHEQLMGDAVSEAVILQKQADLMRQDSLDMAEDITPMPANPATGKTRKTFTSR
jgi:hypothetical protein